MPETTWNVLTVDDLDVRTLHEVLRLRSEVFVVEQDCAYQDVDGADLAPGTLHVIGWRGDESVAAYARVLEPDAERPSPRIGRVLTAPTARGLSLGREAVRRAIAVCEGRWPDRPITLEAQAHLRAFYESLGFAVRGEGYVEDGIAHLPMRRDLR